MMRRYPKYLDLTTSRSIKEEPLSEEDAVSDLPLDCMLCAKHLHSLSGLKAHVIAHHNYKSVKRKADGSFSPEKSKSASKLSSYICTICKRHFTTSTDLKVHEVCHDKFTCFACNAKFDSFKQVTQHRMSCKVKTDEVAVKKHITLTDILKERKKLKSAPWKPNESNSDQIRVDKTFRYAKNVNDKEESSAIKLKKVNNTESEESDSEDDMSTNAEIEDAERRFKKELLGETEDIKKVDVDYNKIESELESIFEEKSESQPYVLKTSIENVVLNKEETEMLSTQTEPGQDIVDSNKENVKMDMFTDKQSEDSYKQTEKGKSNSSQSNEINSGVRITVSNRMIHIEQNDNKAETSSQESSDTTEGSRKIECTDISLINSKIKTDADAIDFIEKDDSTLDKVHQESETTKKSCSMDETLHDVTINADVHNIDPSEKDNKTDLFDQDSTDTTEGKVVIKTYLSDQDPCDSTKERNVRKTDLPDQDNTTEENKEFNSNDKHVDSRQIETDVDAIDKQDYKTSNSTVKEAMRSKEEPVTLEAVDTSQNNEITESETNASDRKAVEENKINEDVHVNNENNIENEIEKTDLASEIVSH